ncbi:MAG: undecaprenyl/decaprenyl-phosphate alpha-N-acetylglucosaminyl 1-phosphate transferase [Planctomycetes bacterium]|nr:undecaprenyl/decaprenyl-phosphate alpha-N-acetylglucosaminyl 1-phosphate transferase [Planctomycetota bacterium]
MSELLGVFSVLCFLSTFIVSVLLTIVAKKLTVRFGLLARPRNDRFHKKIVPLGGGIAIFFTILFACLAAIVLVKILVAGNITEICGWNFEDYIQGFSYKARQLWVIMGCSAALFLLGLWDDIKNLKPIPKLLAQFAVAFAAAYWGDVRVELFIESRIITSILSSFWIVLVINIFNFLDNMDGASAGIAVIISMILFIIAGFSGQAFVSGFAMILGGTLVGFLIFNFYPALIFMGDAGSLVIGFFIAMLTLRTTYHQIDINHWYAVLAPLVIMAIPLYDFISVTVLRISQRKSPFVGDTQHFSHRLKKLGLTEFQTVLTLYLATIATGLGAVALTKAVWPYGLLIFLQTIMVLEIIVLLESAGKNGKK